MKVTDQTTDPASFRDPAGFIFSYQGVLYRQVNRSYQADYDLLLSSGLYNALTSQGLMVLHKETEVTLPQGKEAYKVIEPERIPFISYPYEWCFSALADAALLTLEIQRIALEHGMILKDASAYNIQFHKSRPILIDSLSFERYEEGKPWIAYRQFCQHFLAPLALMSLTDIRLSTLLHTYIDGIPLDLTDRLLPGKARVNIGLLTHLSLHAMAQNRYQKAGAVKTKARFSQFALLGLIESLKRTIQKLKLPKHQTEWGDYYENTNYTDAGFAHKQEIVKMLLELVKPKTICDIGANDSLFSKLASDKGVWVLSVDSDPLAVEKGYRAVRGKAETNILPLIVDITNPSPAIGWANQERADFLSRASVDVVVALALIHHLAISNNVPLKLIAAQFAALAPSLIIEFVPKDDSQVQKLLETRHDHFTEYTVESFEMIFGAYYRLKERIPVKESKRIIYLMEKK